MMVVMVKKPGAVTWLLLGSTVPAGKPDSQGATCDVSIGGCGDAAAKLR